MKIVIFLNGDRGISVFNSVLKHKKFEIVGVITPENFTLKDFKSLNMPHFTFQNVNERAALKLFKELSPDIFLIAGYSDIFRSEILSIPKLGTLNLHAGKLPEYRGGSPLNWQIINGETKAGLSIIEVDKGIDSGPIICETEIPITVKSTILDLHNLANLKFPDLVIAALNKYACNPKDSRKQDENLAKYWHQRNDNDGKLDFVNSSAIEIERTIRALTKPYPGAWANYQRHKVRIFEAELSAINLCGCKGRICYIQNIGPYVVCKEQAILIKSYLIENNQQAKLKHGEYLN